MFYSIRVSWIFTLLVKAQRFHETIEATIDLGL